MEIPTENKTEDYVLERLPELHKHFINLLEKLGAGHNQTCGTYLMMKDNQEEMEDFLIWMYDNCPTPEEMHERLVERMLQQPSRGAPQSPKKE